MVSQFKARKNIRFKEYLQKYLHLPRTIEELELKTSNFSVCLFSTKPNSSS